MSPETVVLWENRWWKVSNDILRFITHTQTHAHTHTHTYIYARARALPSNMYGNVTLTLWSTVSAGPAKCTDKERTDPNSKILRVGNSREIPFSFFFFLLLLQESTIGKGANADIVVGDDEKRGKPHISIDVHEWTRVVIFLGVSQHVMCIAGRDLLRRAATPRQKGGSHFLPSPAKVYWHPANQS